MKKLIILLLLAISHFQSISQVDTVYIDFLHQTDIPEHKLVYKKKYCYVLTNINRFVYTEVTANQKGEDLNITPPEIFSTFKFPGFIASSVIEETAPFDKMVPDATIPEKAIDGKKRICDCMTIEEILRVTPAKTFADSIKIYEAAFKALTDRFTTYVEVNKRLEKLKINTRSTWAQIETEKISTLRSALGLTLNEVDVNERISNEYVGLRNLAIATLDDKLKRQIDLLSIEVESHIKKYQRCADDLKQTTCGKDTCSQDYIRIKNNLKEVQECIEKLKAFNRGLAKYLERANAAVTEMRRAIEDGKIHSVQNNYNLLVEKNFRVELDPFIADKDVFTINFNAVAKGPLPYGSPATRAVKINSITKGGWKMDYSAGVFLNMGSNKFLGPSYYYDNPTDSTKIIREAGRSKEGMLSIGALLHIYPRIISFIRPAFAVGVSTTSGFDTFNLHGGISAILGKPGKSGRFIISGGVTLREVELLNTRYQLDVERGDYPEVIPVSKNFPIGGGFISLSYNLKKLDK